jgi:CspA family cold shock protein
MSDKPFRRRDRGTSRRGFDDDNFGYQPPSFGSAPRAPRPMMQSFAGSGTPAKATVKWFNPEKGFGFVSPTDGSGDAFLHVSALQAAGLDSVGEGATMECEIGQGQKGRQVMRVTSVDTSTATPARPRRGPPGGPGGGGGGSMNQPIGDPVEMTGTVKWYQPEKGFGFVSVCDGGKDVFVHTSVLKRFNIATLEPEQQVRMTVVATPKGREATAIWIA